MSSLPVMKPGDRITGQACLIPTNICFCAACDCYRRAEDGDNPAIPDGWIVKRFDGIPYFFCPLHEEEDVRPKWLADTEERYQK